MSPESAERNRETGDPDVVREIGHDEYDPIGTVVLIGLYFLVLLVMWFFMYFVEFLGNEPTVTGSISAVAAVLGAVVA